MSESNAPLLLAIIEMGGYPNFTPLYERLGFRVEMETSGRRAMVWLKRNAPAVVVAEFNVEPAFRDRTSNLESILATLQRRPGTRVVVFYEPGTAPALEKLRQRFSGFEALAFPVDEALLERALTSAPQAAGG